MSELSVTRGMQAKAGDPFIQNVVEGIYTCGGHFFFLTLKWNLLSIN